MKSNSTFSRLFAIALMLLAVNFTFAQNVITVDNNSTHAADYDNLQTAINAANNGDIIYVQHSNTSYGTITVTKQVKIIGRSYKETNYVTYVDNLHIKSSNVTVKGLFINSQLTIQSANSTPITNIQVKECRSGLVLLGSTYPVNNVVLQGNYFADRLHQYTYATNVMVMNNFIVGEIRSYMPQTFLFTQNIGWENQLYNYGDANGILQISNSIFITNSWSMGIETSGRYKIQNSLTYNYLDYPSASYTFSDDANPANTLENVDYNVNPQFVNWTNDLLTSDFHLAPGSPAIDAGFDGEDLGVYHNYAFSTEGNPIGYPTLTIDSAPSSVPAGSALNVTVTAEAH